MNIEKILDEQEIVPVFQPIVSLENGDILGYEICSYKLGTDLVFFGKKLFYLIIAFYIFFTFSTQRINIRAI